MKVMVKKTVEQTDNKEVEPTEKNTSASQDTIKPKKVIVKAPLKSLAEIAEERRKAREKSSLSPMAFRDSLKTANANRVSSDLLERAKKQGFNSVEEYLAWQKERSKGSDVGLEGMGSGTTKAGKSCRTETGDSTKRIR